MSKIIQLSEAVSLALHSMVIIAKSKKLVNVNCIADSTGASKNHLAKVLQRLVKSDLLKSDRGPSGGFKLKKSPEKITLLEIYEVIEGKINFSACPFSRNKCPFDKCMMDDMVNNISEEFHNFLENKTLSDYL